MILQGSIEYFSRFFRLKLTVSDNRGFGSRFDFYLSGVRCSELMLKTINEVKSVGIGWN